MNGSPLPQNTRKFFSWREKPVLGAGLFFVSVVAAYSWYTVGQIKSQVRRDVAGTLQVSLATSREALRHWVSEKKAEVSAWASRPGLRSAVRGQLAAPRGREALLSSPGLTALDQFLGPLLKEDGYLGYIVVAPGGVAIASSFKTDMGAVSVLAAQGDFLSRVFGGEVMLCPSRLVGVPAPAVFGASPPGPALFAAVPIREDGGDIVAALAVLISVRDLSAITRLGRPGETGETYAFDRDGGMLTESRFEGQLRVVGLLPPGGHAAGSLEIRDPGNNMVEGFRPTVPRERQPLTRMAADATAGNSGLDVVGYRDYRGVPVVGAWTWDKELGLGLASEIDVAEAYKSFWVIRALTISALAVATLLFLGLAAVQDEASKARLAHERTVHEKEARMSAVTDHVFDAVVIIDERGTVDSVNPATERVFGYARSELVGENVNKLMPEPYRSEHDGHLQRYLASGQGRVIGIGREVEGMRKDGTVFPADLALVEMFQEDRRLFIGVVRDISERKRIENELRDSREDLRNLAIRLQTAHEDERLRVAREIHDELGQALTLMKMNASWIGGNPHAGREDILKKTQLMSRLADNTIDAMRRIASGLRPGILDDLGVSAAIEWHSLEFQERTGLKCVLDMEPEEMRLDAGCALALFRIYQEAMTNVIRHARGADTVVVRLRKADGHVVLEVRDNGCGIAGDRLSGSKSLGLLGMRERARSYGGTVEVVSRAGEGTAVVLQFPVHPA